MGLKRPCESSGAARKPSCSPRMRSMPTGRIGRPSSGWGLCRSSVLLSSRSAAMKLKLDGNYCDLLSAFRACRVRYLIIGGWAVSIHAQPRATKDMDIFVSPEPANIDAVYEALIRFGAPLKNMDKSQFLEPGTFFRIGAPPCQIEIFPEIPGVQFEACWPNRLEVPLDAENVLSANFISTEDLIAAKIASGREQDVADAQAIKRAQQQKRKP